MLFDKNLDCAGPLVLLGGQPAQSIGDLVRQLKRPRIFWLMVPSGEPTGSIVRELSSCLDSGDIIIDGGNTYYQDDLQRSKCLAPKGIHYVDVGTSGGIHAYDRGYCLTVGCNREIYDQLAGIFTSLAAQDSDGSYSVLHCGPVGSGHFVKMVHNAIEYGLMQAYAEGFELLQRASDCGQLVGNEYSFNLFEIASNWRNGSLVSSTILDLIGSVLERNQNVQSLGESVADTGEGRWAIQTGTRLGVAMPVTYAALGIRLKSQQSSSLANRLLAAVRESFGGHKAN